MQCTYKRNIAVRSFHHCGHGNTKSIAYSERTSVALANQDAKRMRGTLLLSAAPLPLTFHIIS